MLINGPIKVGILDSPEQQGRELHITFTDDFRAGDMLQQASEFRRYIDELTNNISTLPADDANRAGMLIIQQIAEQLYQPIASGELELDETIIVEIGRDHSSNSLMSLLST